MKKMYMIIGFAVLVGIVISILWVPSQKQIVEDVQEDSYLYADISPVNARNMINTNSNLVIIDVSPNYAKGHLPGAINYYVGDGSLDAAIPSLDKTKDYLVYCHVESASRLGAQKLIDAGFTTVYRLDGEYGAWVDAGYEVEI